jgi:hypothetical protein
MTYKEWENIRKKISCPQFGDDHYGEWGILNINQRRTIKRMLDFIDGQENYIKSQQAEIEHLQLEIENLQASKKALINGQLTLQKEIEGIRDYVQEIMKTENKLLREVRKQWERSVKK